MPTADSFEDNPLLDPAQAEEESLFPRRSKPVQVRRRRFSRRAWVLFKWSLVVLMAATPFGYVAYRLTGYLLHSPRFRLTSPGDVGVEGIRYVSRDEVLNALGWPLTPTTEIGVNIFRMRLDVARKQLETIPWVQSATVERAFPNRIVVHIVERVPIAFVNVGGRVKLVDSEGVLLEKPEHGDFAFPVVEGLEAAGDPVDRRARLDVFRDFMQALADEASTAGWLISEVDLSDSDDLKALLVQGRDTILVHFGRQDFARRFQGFLSLVPELRRSNARINSVDLRYRNQVVVNPQPASGLSDSLKK